MNPRATNRQHIWMLRFVAFFVLCVSSGAAAQYLMLHKPPALAKCSKDCAAKAATLDIAQAPARRTLAPSFKAPLLGVVPLPSLPPVVVVALLFCLVFAQTQARLPHAAPCATPRAPPVLF